MEKFDSSHLEQASQQTIGVGKIRLNLSGKRIPTGNVGGFFAKMQTEHPDWFHDRKLKTAYLKTFIGEYTIRGLQGYIQGAYNGSFEKKRK